MLTFTVFWAYISFSPVFPDLERERPRGDLLVQHPRVRRLVVREPVPRLRQLPAAVPAAPVVPLQGHPQRSIRRIAYLILAVIFVDISYNILPALKDANGNPLPFLSWHLLWAAHLGRRRRGHLHLRPTCAASPPQSSSRSATRGSANASATMNEPDAPAPRPVSTWSRSPLSSSSFRSSASLRYRVYSGSARRRPRTRARTTWARTRPGRPPRPTAGHTSPTSARSRPRRRRPTRG